MKPATPEDLHPNFKSEYFEKLASYMYAARAGSLERLDTDFGDDAQVLGIRAYKNFVKTINEIQGSDGHEWLCVTEPKGRMTIMVDGVPVRVWRSDDPEADSEDRRLEVALETMSQISLLLKVSTAPDRWGLVYQTDRDGMVIGAVLFGYDYVSKNVMCRADVSITDMADVSLQVMGNIEEAVLMEPTPIKPKKLDQLGKVGQVSGKQDERNE